MFDRLDEELQRLIKAVRKAEREKSGDSAAGVCQASRIVNMACVFAANTGDRSWNKELGEKILRTLDKAIRATEGTVFERNIAARAKFLSSYIQQAPPTSSFEEREKRL